MRWRRADLRLLHLSLADAASGTPRQWWHLELAAEHKSSGAASLSGRLLALLLNRAGLDLCLPLLQMLALPGLQPYQLAQPASAYAAPWSAIRAARLSLAGLGLLIGLGSLNASRQLLLLVIAILGAMLAGALAWRAARRDCLRVRAAQNDIALALTPAESALGLPAMLLAAGHGYAEAEAIAASWRQAPDQADRTVLAQLGLLAPAGALRSGCWRGLCWLGATLLIAWPCWLTERPWQLLPACAGASLLHYLHARFESRWPSALLRTLSLGAAALALGFTLSRLLWPYRAPAPVATVPAVARPTAPAASVRVVP
ncbi:hypothetical protein [Chitinimonas sp.]|uniref:hypothetical protein n=1 Tax=Chitinimonas sp. TaxID=1934313 RepID=UPI0035B15C76